MGGDDIETAVRERVGAIASGVRFGKFVSVGAVGAVCDTLVLLTLSEVVGAPPEVAWLAGVETAILVMFLVNEHWTFADHAGPDRGSVLARLQRSHLVRAGGVTTQFVIFEVVYRVLFVDVSLGDLSLWTGLTAGLGVPLAGLDLWLLVAKGLGIGVGMLVNYVFESLFTWRVHE
jgi:putative flippase GtrA